MSVNRQQIIEHEIIDRLWGICDRGRESLSASVYVYHMLILLWIKYRSDRKREERAGEQDSEWHFNEISFEEIDFKEIDRERQSKYIGHMINQYMRMIFEEVDFGNIYIFGKESNLLEEMIGGIGALDLRPSRLGDDKMLSRVCLKFTERIIKTEERGNGVEWMPEEVAKLMIQLMAIG
ncbi:MAG: hypothetical protein ACRC1P_11230, partial [Cellulosilyticaceae bacterium]